MSRWGGFYASFRRPTDEFHRQFFTEDRLVENIDPRRCPPPLGSEAGYHTDIHTHESYSDGSGDCININVRIRDVHDYMDSFQCLAWFVYICEWYNIPSAELIFEIDDGPRHVFYWSDKKLVKESSPFDILGG